MPLLPGAEPLAVDGGPIGAVVLHGFTGTPQAVRDWGLALADAGLTVTVPRLPGHGTRWQDMARTRWTDWYGEAERAFDELRRCCAEVFVCGLSMGGTLALRLAEQRAERGRRSIVVNASLATERKDAKLLPLLRHVIPAFPGIAGDIAKPGVKELAYAKMPLQAAHSLSQLWALTRADLGADHLPRTGLPQRGRPRRGADLRAPAARGRGSHHAHRTGPADEQLPRGDPRSRRTGDLRREHRLRARAQRRTRSSPR